MATQTTHYHLIKPASADRVAVGDLNDNADTIDGYLYQANERADQIADDYNTSSTYNIGDYCRRENYIYKCNSDSVTGNWDSTKWDRVKVMESVETAEDGVDNAFKTMGIIGAKNLLPYPYAETTKTQNGITYTVNSDGTITVSGTAERGSSFNLTPMITNNPFKDMILTGCPQGGSGTTFYIRDRITNNGVLVSQILDIGEGNTIGSTDEGYAHQIMLSVNSGTIITTPITFRPMIRPEAIKDSTYVPYAMTNKDITNIVKCNQSTAGTYTLQATVASNGTVTYGWVPTT